MAKLAVLISLVALAISILAYQQVGGVKDLNERMEIIRKETEKGLAVVRKETAEGLAAVEKALRPSDAPTKAKR